MNSAQVLVADAEGVARSDAAAWLGPAGYGVSTAATAAQALALAREQRFDVALVDMALPDMRGLDLLAALKALDPTIAVVMWSGAATLQDAVAALRHGRAFDFLEKPLADWRDLNVVIELALAHRARGHLPAAGPQRYAETLGERDRELLALLAEGLDNRAIARRVGLGEGTVRNLLTRVYGVLDVENRTQAVLRGQRAGLLEPRPPL